MTFDNNENVLNARTHGNSQNVLGSNEDQSDKQAEPSDKRSYGLESTRKWAWLVLLHFTSFWLVLLHFTSCPIFDDVTATPMGVSSIGKWGFWATFHVFFSRFYVRIFHVKINLDRGCLRGVGYFFPWIADVWEVWDIFFLRSRMFERCGVWIFTCNFTLENFYV